MEFLTPRPLLLTAGLDARVCIWTVRPAFNRQRYVCIYQFINKTMHTDNLDVKTGVYSCAVIHSDKIV